MNFFSIVKEQNRFKNVSSSLFKHIFFFFFLFVIIIFGILCSPFLPLSNLFILIFYLSSPGAISLPSAPSFSPLATNNGFYKRITSWSFDFIFCKCFLLKIKLYSQLTDLCIFHITYLKNNHSQNTVRIHYITATLFSKLIE